MEHHRGPSRARSSGAWSRIRQLLRAAARKVLAWEDIDAEAAALRFDEEQSKQLAENLGRARRDLRETVWRAYKSRPDRSRSSTALGLWYRLRPNLLVGPSRR